MGSNAGLYALKIMHYIALQLNQYDSFIEDSEFDLPPYSKVRPRDLLLKSYEMTNADAQRDKIIGSTTAIVGVLRVLDIDSGGRIENRKHW